MIPHSCQGCAYALPMLCPPTTLEQARQCIAPGCFTDVTNEELEALADQEPGKKLELTAWIQRLIDEELNAIIYDLPEKPAPPAAIALEDTQLIANALAISCAYD